MLSAVTVAASFLRGRAFVTRGLIGAVALLAASCGGSSASPSASPAVPATVGPAAAPTTFVSVPGLKDEDVRGYLVDLAYFAGVPDRLLHKWLQPVTIFLYGDVRPEDRSTVEAVTAELKTLTGLAFSFAQSAGQENMSIHFVPMADFPRLVRTAGPNSRTAFDISPAGATGGGTGKAIIVIDSAGAPAPLSPALRAFFIRRLIPQSLGLVNVGVNTYPDSVFASTLPPGPPQAYTALDKKVIQLLYADVVKVGMDEAALRRALTPGQ